MSDHIPDCTDASIAAAKRQNAIDRAQVAKETGWLVAPDGTLVDPVALGLRLGNVISAAVYGPQGEWRE